MTILRDFRPRFLSESLVRHRFIETGLYAGDTLAHAVQHEFERLDGIEVHPDWVQHCGDRFGHDARVRVHYGSSPEVLGKIIEDVPTTFWLDAHFTGDPERKDLMDPRYGECPLLAELAVITAFPWTVRPIVLIDDAHMYRHEFWETQDAQNFDRRQWPRWKRIKRALADYQVSVHDHVIYAL